MEMTKVEMLEVQKVAEVSEVAVLELTQLQLAAIGGGVGEVIFG